MQKEQYFTEENRIEKTKLWLEECKKIRSRKPYKLDFSKSALLILDMQEYFLNEESHAYIPSSPTIINSISMLIRKFEEKDGIIVFSKHIDDDSPANMMNKWWGDSLRRDNPLGDITEKLQSFKEAMFIKEKYSAFYGTVLEKILSEYKIKQVVITGVMTHLCCETTARDAFMRDFEVFFVVDATATYTEQLHLGSLRSLAHGFGICISTEEILNEE